MTKARQAAAEAVLAVCHSGDLLDSALDVHRGTISQLEAGLFQEIAYGGVRWYLAYQHYLNAQLKKPFKPKDKILEALLITALYQLDYTQQAPHAVVNESVALAKTFKRGWASGIVNAILRAYIRQQKDPPAKLDAHWIRSSFPDWLLIQISDAWPDQTETILRCTQNKPPMTLRVDLQKHARDEYLKLLSAEHIQASLCEQSSSGITLDEAVPVNRLPGFDQAWVSVQDESAQLATPNLDIASGHRVLDACAAPGGKSLQILQSGVAICELVVLDLPHRITRLQENIDRSSLDATIIEGDLLEPDTWWDENPFDRILLDVPCTGTGVIRRHPDIKLRRRKENILQFANNQFELIKHAWKVLKPGGKLLYSTCSILPAENEHCVADFVLQTPSAIALELSPSLGLKTAHGRQRLPGVHTGDGFFYALLQKAHL